METRSKPVDPVIRWSVVVVVSIFLIGLLLFSYQPFVILIDGDTRLLRPDWLLSIPLFAYFVYRRQPIEIGPSHLWSLLLLCLVVISPLFVFVYSLYNHYTFLIQLVYAIVLFTVVSSFRLRLAEFVRLLRVWTILVSITAIFGMLELLQSFIFTSARFSGSYYQIRPSSIFSEPNFFALTLVTAISVLFPCVILDRAVLFKRRTQQVVLGWLVVVLFLSGSLAGYLDFLFLIFVLAALPWTRRRMMRLLTSFCVLGLLFFAGATGLDVGILDLFVHRIDKIYQLVVLNQFGYGSLSMRYARILGGLSAWLHHPIFGVGVGQYGSWITSVDRTVLLLPDSFPGAVDTLHGGWIHALATTGGIGFVCFAGIWLTCVRYQWLSITRFGNSPVEQTASLSGILLTLVLLIAWFFDFTPLHTYRWGFIGLTYGFARNRIDEQLTLKLQY